MRSPARRGVLALVSQALRVAPLAFAAFATLAVPRPVLAQGKKAPATAPKDPKLADAKKLFDDGALAYGRGDYEQAIKLWDQSYALSQQPLILYNLANAWEKLGDFKKTRENLGKWRDAAPPEEREMLDLRLKNLDARIEREEEAARKAAAEKAALEAQRRVPVPVPPDRSWVPGAVVAGVGAAAVIAGVAVDLVANGKRPSPSLCMKASNGQTLCQTAAEGPISTSNRMAIAGDVTWIVGAAAVATGVVLILVRKKPPRDMAAPPPAAALWVAPLVSVGGSGAILGGSF
jgi:hypothetical protein